MTNANFIFKVGHKSRSRSEVIFFMSGKPLSQETYMPNIKAVSQMVQSHQANLNFFFKVGHRSRSRSQVKILYEWEALVTRNLHAKYEGSN